MWWMKEGVMRGVVWRGGGDEREGKGVN